MNHQLSSFQDDVDTPTPMTLYDLEQVLKRFPQTEEIVTHHFGGGVYARELFIPAGNLIIGKRHRHESLNMVLKGHISVFVAPGLPVRHLYAPAIFTSPPLSKKMGYAHEDTVFVNVHPTTETDLEKIEAEFIITEDEYKKLRPTEAEFIITKEEYKKLGRIDMENRTVEQKIANELDLFFRRNEGNRLSMEMIQGLALNLQSIFRGDQKGSSPQEGIHPEAEGQ